MELKDLKTGMLAKVRNGDIYIILTNVLDFGNESIVLADITKENLKRYCICDSDMLHFADKDMDVVEVYLPPTLLSNTGKAIKDSKLIWRRPVRISKQDAIKELAKLRGVDPSLITIE